MPPTWDRSKEVSHLQIDISPLLESSPWLPKTRIEKTVILKKMLWQMQCCPQGRRSLTLLGSPGCSGIVWHFSFVEQEGDEEPIVSFWAGKSGAVCGSTCCQPPLSDQRVLGNQYTFFVESPTSSTIWNFYFASWHRRPRPTEKVDLYVTARQKSRLLDFWAWVFSTILSC